MLKKIESAPLEPQFNLPQTPFPTGQPSSLDRKILQPGESHNI
jgi:hypothetical protein